MTASRRRPVVAGRESSALAAATGVGGASPTALRVSGGAPEPAAAVGHWPTPAATRPTAASTARAAYLRLVQVMARTTPSAKKMARADAPAPAGGRPARRAAAA